MADFAKLIVEVDSKGVKRTRGELGRFTKSAGKAEKATSKLAAAWRSYGKLITGAAIVYGLRSVIKAAAEQEQTLAQLRAGLESTGRASGQTVQSLRALSAEMQRTTMFSNETVEAAEGILLSFTAISGEAFPRTIKAAANVATRMGTDLRSAVVQLGKALNDPVQNLGALSRSGIQFTKEQKKLIKEMWETNRAAEAQKIILNELDTQYGKSAQAAKETLGGAIAGLRNEWDDFKKAVGEGIAPVAKPTLSFFAQVFKAPAKMMKDYETIMESWGKTAKQKSAAFDAWFFARNKQRLREQQETASAQEGLSKASASARLAIIERAFEDEGTIRLRAFDAERDETRQFLTTQIKLHRAGTEERRRLTEISNTWELKQYGKRLEIEERYQKDKSKLAAATAAADIAATKAAAAAADVFIEEARAAQDASTEAARALGREMQQLTLTFGTSLIDTLFDAEARSKMTFGNIADDFARMVARMMAQQALLAAVGLPSMFTPTAVARGAAFVGGRVTPMARGGIVTEPTLFPMQRGAGLMGEAGPEAVMPLTRTSSGELGVRAEGAGAEVNVNIINNTGARVTQRRRQNGRGVEVDVMIGESVDRQVKDGRFDRSLQSSFGLSRRGAR